jgi:hypothetical protein
MPSIPQHYISFKLLLPIAGVILALSAQAQTNIIVDPGFDLAGPIASGSASYGSNSSDGTPTTTFSGGNWSFSSNAGLIHSANTGFSPPSPFPTGNQAGFLQSGNTFNPDPDPEDPLPPEPVPLASTILSVSSYAFAPGTTYNLSFYQASRSGSLLDYAVALSNGQTLFTRTTAAGEAWTQYSTSFSVAEAGSYQLSFVTTATGDNTAFFDSVSVSTSAVPEPSTFVALMGFAALGATLTGRRRRNLVPVARI